MIVDVVDHVGGDWGENLKTLTSYVNASNKGKTDATGMLWGQCGGSERVEVGQIGGCCSDNKGILFRKLDVKTI